MQTARRAGRPAGRCTKTAGPLPRCNEFEPPRAVEAGARAAYRVIAPSEALETSLAYLPSTPVASVDGGGS